jgi:hypothetical protein
MEGIISKGKCFRYTDVGVVVLVFPSFEIIGSSSGVNLREHQMDGIPSAFGTAG